jgi:type IV pilus assembly protein PilB
MVEYDLHHIPIVDIVNQIILYAAQHSASDIHMDPREDCLIIRMRMDGQLRDHTIIPKEYERNLVTRVKLISNMNITETRLPQDGAIKGRIEGKDLDMRVSALPTNEGEKIVIRILDFTKSLTGMESLGFSNRNFKLVEKMMAVPNGIILVTGATGSGKSTTTYSMLQALNKEETNIITVEDPIEMNIEGINQVQVNSDIVLSFATVLRSILRQDPNIILIGEIRDSETAQIAVRASITGHLVLSTIHTNDSLSTIERLLDMDVERYLLSSALTGIISQKLVRTLCPECKKKRPVTPYEEHFFRKMLNKYVPEIYEPVGCPHCNRGFKGRMAVHEVLYITDHLRDVISDPNIDKEELRKIVYDGEVTTLLQDALQKVIEGHTTFNEVVRIVEVDADLEKSVIKEVKVVETKVKYEKEKENFEVIDAFELEVIDAFSEEIEIIDMFDYDPNTLTLLNT